MRSLRKKEGLGTRARREPAKKRFARWLAAPLLACGMAFSGGCGMIPHASDNSPTGSDHTLPPPECETIHDTRTVNGTTTQEQERTYCKGALSLEVSAFTPPLNNGITRQSVWIGDEEVSLLGSTPPSAQNPDTFGGIIQLISKGTDYSLSPGASISLFDGPNSLVLDEIDEHGAYITITDGTTPIIEHLLLRFAYYWYFVPLGNGTALVTDLYGLWRTENPRKCTANISVFRARSSADGNGLEGSSELNNETEFFMASGYSFTTPDGLFHVDAEWSGNRLAGWTLSRE